MNQVVFEAFFAFNFFLLCDSFIVKLKCFHCASSFSSQIHMEGFPSQDAYLSYLRSSSSLPKGFSVGTSRFNFRPFEVDKILPMNLTIIKLEEPTRSFSAMFTSNQFPGGPVIVGKNRIASSETLQAVVINNKISNVCPGGGVNDSGASDSEKVCQSVAKYLGIKPEQVFPSSTGIIGWRLPVQSIQDAVPLTLKDMQTSAFPAALAITTTDRYPKVRSITSKNNNWNLVGIAKGAGMIEPNMATMLCYLMTDLKISKAKLSDLLKAAVSKSFNAISVDGDQSTSDTVLILSSEKVDATENDVLEFSNALNHICQELAEDIIRNGEGTQHVIKVTVKGAPSEPIANKLGKAIVNSNLVKCAISGSDPNVGRIVGAIGSYLGTISNGKDLIRDLSIKLGGIEIFNDGCFDLSPEKELQLSDYMFDAQLYPVDMLEHDRNYPRHFKCVDIEINFPRKDGSNCESIVFGSDLTQEYVSVNADYRS